MSQIAYKIRNSLYLNITDRCTLACEFCPKTHGVLKVHEYDLTLASRPEADEIIQSIGDPRAYDEIVFCGYGEPTLRLKTLKQIATWVKEHGGMVRINTDGLASLVNKRNVLPELKGLVDAISVSMNAQEESVYNRHCQPALPGSYQAMLDFLEQAPAWIPHVSATAIDGLEGVDIEACEKLAHERGVEFRPRKLDNLG